MHSRDILYLPAFLMASGFSASQQITAIELLHCIYIDIKLLFLANIPAFIRYLIFLIWARWLEAEPHTNVSGAVYQAIYTFLHFCAADTRASLITYAATCSTELLRQLL